MWYHKLMSSLMNLLTFGYLNRTWTSTWAIATIKRHAARSHFISAVKRCAECDCTLLMPGKMWESDISYHIKTGTSVSQSVKLSCIESHLLYSSVLFKWFYRWLITESGRLMHSQNLQINTQMITCENKSENMNQQNGWKVKQIQPECSGYRLDHIAAAAFSLCT